MFDDIDPRSPTPLYDQISRRIRVAVAAGELHTGQALPSVRRLAAQLRINPATVVQAYRALESEGFVEMRHGAGTFVREVPPGIRDREREEQAARLVQRLLTDAARTGVDSDALVEAFNDAVAARSP